MTSTLPPSPSSPDVRLPLLVVALRAGAAAAAAVALAHGLVVVLFGLFLLIQTASLRLEFEEGP